MIPFNKPVNSIKYYMVIYKVINYFKDEHIFFKVLIFLEIFIFT